MNERIPRNCRECRQPFTYDAARFMGRRPPGICYRCQEARTARLVATEGEVVETGHAYAVLAAAGRRFYWRHDRPAAPNVATRWRFKFDPQERADGPRQVIARHVEPAR